MQQATVWAKLLLARPRNSQSSELANAKDFQDVLAIQSRYAQTQMQNYVLQAQELGRLTAEAAQNMQPRK